jgi:hypothetical protein
MQRLHLFTAKNGGLNEITWSPLIITPNFYKLFISMNPDHVLTKREIQILVALTQFMPRVLEQSYVSHYKPDLNGTNNGSYNVIFSFTKWVGTEPELITDSNKNDLGVISLNKSNAYKAIDENKIIVASSHSLNGLASILGLSVAGIKYHLGRESFVFAKALGLYVSIIQEGLESKGKPADFYISKKKNKEIP